MFGRETLAFVGITFCILDAKTEERKDNERADQVNWALHRVRLPKLTAGSSLAKRTEMLVREKNTGEEEEGKPLGNDWEELVTLAISPHGRLQLRARGLLQRVLDALKTSDTVEKALRILVDLCKDCDCALELAQRGLHGTLNQLLKQGEQSHEEAVYLAIQVGIV